MFLSDISIKRPVLATVFSLLLVVFGVISFGRLPVREYPDIDPPVVSVETRYPGAAAAVVETRVAQIVEDAISGIEGIRSIDSTNGVFNDLGDAGFHHRRGRSGVSRLNRYHWRINVRVLPNRQSSETDHAEHHQQQTENRCQNRPLYGNVG